MANGYWGKLIEIDMTAGKVEITDRHMQYIDEYIGGQPLAAKMFWEAMKDKPDADPLGPDNVFMLMPGVTSGTGFPGIASRYIAYTKSGLTQAKNSPYGEKGATIGYATSGGKFAAKLKWAGFDGVYATGVSETPKYLYVNNNKAELLDASEYWGMTCVEFEEAMQAKHGYNHTIVSIGPTAENGVRYSAICSEAGRAAGRGGCAVVMGAKKLKGVVVYGDQSLPYAGSKEEYKALFEEMQQLTFSHKTYGDKRQWGSVATLTNNSNAGTCSVRNHREGTNPYDDVIGTVALYLNYFVRHRSCHACPIRCMKTGVAKDGNYKGTIAEGPEYEAAMNGANWLIDNLSDYSGVMQYIEEQGFDLINVGGTVGYALEAYENGVIKSSDIDGIKLEWGNAAEILKFMDKLIYGKGEIWDWFRGGSSYAAWKLDNKLGTQSASYAVDVKNHSFAAHGLQGQAARTMLQSAYSFSNRGACHCAGVNVAGQNNGMIQNMAVSCSRGGTGFMGYPNIVRCMNFVLDKNLTQTDYALIGEKAWNMEKVFNVMNGFRKEDDQLPDRVFDDALTWGPMAGSHMDRDAWAVEWNKYYEQRGWDTETSAPTEGKLQELGLDELIPYLRKALA